MTVVTLKKNEYFFIVFLLLLYFEIHKHDKKILKYTQKADSEYEPPIYYFGDANVTLGEPFSIACFININEPIRWLKDGESITRHNLRHGRDEHSYRLSEFPIEGKFQLLYLLLASQRRK